MLPLQNPTPRLVLASASPARARLLHAMGLDFTVRVMPIDEELVKDGLRADGIAASEAAVALASLKGERVAVTAAADELVIAADQLLEAADGAWPDKPTTPAALRGQLMQLQGAVHRLHTAVALYRNGARIWHHVTSPAVRLRPLGPDFVEAYVAAAGAALLGCGGGYQLEALGPHVVLGIQGDAFAVQGLPLLALADQLRVQGALLA
ncbi:MAG: septum formation protein Maf [Geminicoccaceae bacterium]|nr:MAG: septum formation protein Maf [Geminicoccaceae bacterium]